jgi:hypothetical protein
LLYAFLLNTRSFLLLLLFAFLFNTRSFLLLCCKFVLLKFLDTSSLLSLSSSNSIRFSFSSSLSSHSLSFFFLFSRGPLSSQPLFFSPLAQLFFLSFYGSNLLLLPPLLELAPVLLCDVRG